MRSTYRAVRLAAVVLLIVLALPRMASAKPSSHQRIVRSTTQKDNAAADGSQVRTVDTRPLAHQHAGNDRELTKVLVNEVVGNGPENTGLIAVLNSGVYPQSGESHYPMAALQTLLPALPVILSIKPHAHFGHEHRILYSKGRAVDCREGGQGPAHDRQRSTSSAWFMEAAITDIVSHLAAATGPSQFLAALNQAQKLDTDDPAT